MPSLKDLRNRISSVKSTKKITSAMKMVAAAKLKRAQDKKIVKSLWTKLPRLKSAGTLGLNRYKSVPAKSVDP